MSLFLAFKAFVKAYRNPKKGEEFINEKEPKQITASTTDTSHLRLLGVLQGAGRLVDFLKEEIKDYTDAQIGAVVRKIHQDCAKVLEEQVTIRSVMSDEEGATVKIPPGYDPAHIKVIGKVDGKPPYTGTVVHKGWIAHKRSLTKTGTAQHSDIICPAEVEVR